MSQQITAIEIKTPEIFAFVCAFDPAVSENKFEDVKNYFFVPNFNGAGNYAILSPENVGTLYDRIENGSTLTLKYFK